MIRNFEDAPRAPADRSCSCVGTACGTPIRRQDVNGIRAMGGQIDNRYVAATLMKDGAEAFVSSLSVVATQLDVVEMKAMEAGLVTVNADAMAAGIDAEGSHRDLCDPVRHGRQA